jgi:hypothetical protein
MKKVGRNDPCPCGSGKKYKQCHEAKARSLSPWQRVGVGALLAIVIVGLVLAFTMRQEGGAAQQGVWSQEHGHYH